MVEIMQTVQGIKRSYSGHTCRAVHGMLYLGRTTDLLGRFQLREERKVAGNFCKKFLFFSLL
jgi:hypothetical protein